MGVEGFHMMHGGHCCCAVISFFFSSSLVLCLPCATSPASHHQGNLSSPLTSHPHLFSISHLSSLISHLSSLNSQLSTLIFQKTNLKWGILISLPGHQRWSFSSFSLFLSLFLSPFLSIFLTSSRLPPLTHIKY